MLTMKQVEEIAEIAENAIQLFATMGTTEKDQMWFRRGWENGLQAFVRRVGVEGY